MRWSYCVGLVRFLQTVYQHIHIHQTMQKQAFHGIFPPPQLHSGYEFGCLENIQFDSPTMCCIGLPLTSFLTSLEPGSTGISHPPSHLAGSHAITFAILEAISLLNSKNGHLVSTTVGVHHVFAATDNR